MMRLIGKLLHDVRGATAIEYGLIAAVVVIAMLAGFIALANVTTGIWGDVATKVANTSS